MGLGLGCCRWTSLVIGYMIALLLARCWKRMIENLSGSVCRNHPFSPRSVRLPV